MQSFTTVGGSELSAKHSGRRNIEIFYTVKVNLPLLKNIILQVKALHRKLLTQ